MNREQAGCAEYARAVKLMISVCVRYLAPMVECWHRGKWGLLSRGPMSGNALEPRPRIVGAALSPPAAITSSGPRTRQQIPLQPANQPKPNQA